MENLKINTSSLLKVAPAAALASAAINSVLYFIGDSVGLMDKTVGIPGSDGGIQPITLFPVIMSSIIPTLIAAGVLALLNRFTANPLRIYGIVTIVLFLVTLANPFMSIPNIPLGMGIWLDVMHAVVAGVAWYAFSRYTKNK
jgi:uncharacterized membrane protein HdeD (DUF308 family)